MIKKYNNRTQMFKDYGVQPINIMDALRDNVITYGNHSLEFEAATIKVVATSAGTYGINGAVIEATRLEYTGYNIPTYFGIKGRTSLLFKVV